MMLHIFYYYLYTLIIKLRQMGIFKSARKIAVIFAMSIVATINAEVPINYKATIIGSIGNGDFAPYYISSLNHGIITQRDNTLLRLSAWKPLSTDTRFSYGFGVDFLTGWSSGVSNFGTTSF